MCKLKFLSKLKLCKNIGFENALVVQKHKLAVLNVFLRQIFDCLSFVIRASAHLTPY